MSILRCFLFPVILLLCTSFACGDKSTEPDVNYTSTFPLAVGNYWHYRVTSCTIPLHRLSDSDTVIADIYCTVSGIEDIGNITDAYVIVDSSVYPNGNGYIMRKLWWKMVDSELREYAYAQVPDYPNIYDTARVIYDFPLTPGKSWNSYSIGVVPEKKTVTGQQIISIGDHDFVCERIESKFGPQNGSLDSLIIVEYLNESGLIQRTWDDGYTVYRDSLGVLSDSIHTYGNKELIDYNIIGPNLKL